MPFLELGGDFRRVDRVRHAEAAGEAAPAALTHVIRSLLPFEG